ncbi:MAG: hypothetical protein AB8B79_18365 [Granulosicoccus sp.]
MQAMKTAGCLLAFGLCCAVHLNSAKADVWVFEPSIALDQRFDDNYYLIPAGDGDLSATRLVGELGLSSESQSSVLRGLVRVDGLLTTTNDNGDEGLDSNQIAAFEAKLRSARSRYGFIVSFKQDTPSRDIAADLSDQDALATDTGLNISQASNVARREVELTPNFQYDMTRRLLFDSKATFTMVDHDLPSPQDAIYRRYLDTFPRLPDGSFDGVPLSFNEVTLDDVGGVFTPSGELDNFVEGEIEFGLRYKYSRIETVSLTAGYSQFEAEVEPDPFAIIPFEDLEPDSEVRQIVRKPRRDSISTTTSVKLGYERLLTPTITLGVEGGVYTNTTDMTDTLRASDRPGEEIPAERLAVLETSTDGWIASISVTRDAGLTRYVGKFSVDVEPSSSGAQVETNELTGDVFHILSPRLRFALRARAFEPDRLGANREDRFARRFISFEPKLEWEYSRNWTVSGAYRYRRQKAQIDPVAAESNALLFSIKYTPPSEIRDAARANGL